MAAKVKSIGAAPIRSAGVDGEPSSRNDGSMPTLTPGGRLPRGSATVLRAPGLLIR
jgi:hypothetical protein